jgi:hypothetical protein
MYDLYCFRIMFREIQLFSGNGASDFVNSSPNQHFNIAVWVEERSKECSGTIQTCVHSLSRKSRMCTKIAGNH